MYIIMIASECAPAIKVGGLADVVDGLSREISNQGHMVEVVLPKYDIVTNKKVKNLSVYRSGLEVEYDGKKVNCTIHTGTIHGTKCFFIEPHSEKDYFNRGAVYGAKDDDERFAFFSKASIDFLVSTHRNPDVIHCHDWQSGIVPLLVKQLGTFNAGICYTIHNILHQGLIKEKALVAAGLDMTDEKMKEALADHTRDEYCNVMKGAILYSDFTTTVSPQYAWEVRNTNQGYGLEKTIYSLGDSYDGVLNGVEYDLWDPATDTYIVENFSPDSLDGKYKNKEALRKKAGLSSGYKPIIAVISRLDKQKGLPLVKHAFLYAVKNDLQFILLGSSPSVKINEYFMHMSSYYDSNKNCFINIGHDEELAHMVYAGSDFLLIPSLFEPCGLTQMIAMKYGTVPIVRNTGGLANTVFDVDNSERPEHERNGYVFHNFSNDAIEAALHRAVGLWFGYPEKFRQVIINGMTTDYSWSAPASKYLEIYEKILS